MSGFGYTDAGVHGPYEISISTTNGIRYLIRHNSHWVLDGRGLRREFTSHDAALAYIEWEQSL